MQVNPQCRPCFLFYSGAPRRDDKNSCTCSKKAVLGVLRENPVSGKKGCRLPRGRRERMPGRDAQRLEKERVSGDKLNS